MNIQKIKISNILGLEEFEFEPGIFTKIEGRNGSGKTSILEAIKAVLQGGHDAKLLRNGAEKGEIVLVLDDGVKLSKVVTEKKSELFVTNSKGNKFEKPKSYIDALIDMLSVNPVQFLVANKKDRVNYLLEAIPMQLTKKQLNEYLQDASHKVKDDLSGHALDVITRIHKQFYDERTGVNRALKEKTATYKQMQASIPDVTMSSVEMREAIDKLNVEIAILQNEKMKAVAENMNKKSNMLAAEEEKAKLQIAQIQSNLTQVKQQIIEEFETIAETLDIDFDKTYLPKVAEVSKLNERYSHINSIEKQKEIAAQFKYDCKQLDDESKGLSDAIDNLAKLKNDLLSNLSLTGLELIDGDIYYNDVIYDKLNTAQQIEFAVEIAKLRAGEVGIICVDGIERLDNETYTEFKKKAIESGLQLIVTKVTNGDLNLKIERCNNE